MRLAVISFTEKGNELNLTLTRYFLEQGESCRGYVMNRFAKVCQADGLEPVAASLSEWVIEQFRDVDGLIFIGAAGIAVRAIAPCIRDKYTDPGVVVIDEGAQFCIPLLSGHVGGANELAQTAAGIIGAVCVVTTATDINGKFAVDVFARKHGLVLGSKSVAKQVSVDMLEGRPVGFFCDFPLEGTMPDGLAWRTWCQRTVWVTSRNTAGKEEGITGGECAPDREILRLTPKVLVVGVGCRRGTLKADILRAVEEALAEAGRSRDAIEVIASIDLKNEEPGLIQYAEEVGAAFHTYPAKQLLEVPGDYTDSAFVAEVTGVGNVCERAAMLEVQQGGGGCLILKKQTKNGVTVALAEKDWKIRM